jgi:acyl carrier protein
MKINSNNENKNNLMNNNSNKYNKAFNTIFNINVEEITTEIDPNSIDGWDSITHLRLVTTIEDEFNVMLESDEILDFKSYEKGKEILMRYNVEF